MKKLLVAILFVLSAASLTGCAEERTLTGQDTFSWHIPVTTFDVVVSVSLKGDKITEVTVNPASFADTGDYPSWELFKDDFLAQFVGMTVEEVLAIEIYGPVDTGELDYVFKDDVGSVSGEIDVVATASASSIAVLKAIQNALSKY